MESTIKKLNDYFVNKLMNKDFELTKITERLATVSIDSKYVFNFWIANTYHAFECYEYGKNFMDLDFDDTQNKYLHSYFNSLYKERIREDLLKQKENIEKQLKNL